MQATLHLSLSPWKAGVDYDHQFVKATTHFYYGWKLRSCTQLLSRERYKPPTIVLRAASEAEQGWLMWDNQRDALYDKQIPGYFTGNFCHRFMAIHWKWENASVCAISSHGVHSELPGAEPWGTHAVHEKVSAGIQEWVKFVPVHRASTMPVY